MAELKVGEGKNGDSGHGPTCPSRTDSENHPQAHPWEGGG